MFTKEENTEQSKYGYRSYDFDVMERMEGYEYRIIELRTGGKRYIKTINGIRTREWYDVYDGYVLVSDEKYHITKKDVRKAKKIKPIIDTKVPYETYDGYKVTNCFDTYVKIDGKMMLLRVLSIRVDVKDGFSFIEKRIIDLSNGKEIPYEKFMEYTW